MGSNRCIEEALLCLKSLPRPPCPLPTPSACAVRKHEGQSPLAVGMSHGHPALRETDPLPRPRNISPPVENFPFTARTCALHEMCTRRYGHAMCKASVVVGCSTPQHLRSASCSCQLICVQRVLSLCGMSSTHSSVRAAEGVSSDPAKSCVRMR